MSAAGGAKSKEKEKGHKGFLQFVNRRYDKTPIDNFFGQIISAVLALIERRGVLIILSLSALSITASCFILTSIAAFRTYHIKLGS